MRIDHMKKYLITWYGISDFKASLGIEQTKSPILGALLAEDYTDVIILSFSKAHTNLSEFKSKIVEINLLTPTERQQLIDLFLHTEEANQYFNQWLKKELLNANQSVDVHFQSILLTHHNDTKGIYEAANQTLNRIATFEGEKTITFYLNSGTPVMDFIWALSTSRYPTLKQRLITSSQPDKALETIILPNEWIEGHGGHTQRNRNRSHQFDTIFHLFSEQRLPILLGIIQFSSKKHIFLNTQKYPADVMKQFLDEKTAYEQITINPYDPKNISVSIIEIVSKMPPNAKIGFNLTCGTKLMYSGALDACHKVNAIPFYFDILNHRLIYLDHFNSVESKLITSVATFIKLHKNNLLISKNGDHTAISGPSMTSASRKNLTHTLWQNRYKIASFYKKLSHYNDGFYPFKEGDKDKDIDLELDSHQKVQVKIKNQRFEFDKWPDFAKYISGGWLEEYVFTKLKPFVNSGVIKDLRIGLEVSFKEDHLTPSSSSSSTQANEFLGETYQEFDITFTDGRRLYIIECKAGKVTSEHVMKLQNIIRDFGGIDGVGILVSCFSIENEIIKNKLKDARIAHVIANDQLLNQFKEILK
jgi:hypothetical protein